jgi:hypothetical protein
MNMDWSSLGPTLAKFAVPAIKVAITAGVGAIPVVGGFAAPFVADAVGNMIAQAFGSAATPAAVVAAIEAVPPEEAAAKLATVEAEAVAKWPALAQIAAAEEKTAQVQIAATSETIKAEIASSETLPPGFWRTTIVVANAGWRPLFAMEFLFECAYLFFGVITAIIWAIATNRGADIDALVKLMPVWTVLVLPYLAARFGLIGYHMNLRTRDKESMTAAVTDSKPVALDDIKDMLRKAGVKLK